MASSRQVLILFCVVLFGCTYTKQALGQDGPAVTPPSAKVAGQVDDATTPFLQLRPEGVHASIGRLEFSRDGKTLFAVGDSKRVDVWRLVEGRFIRDHQATLRPTIGAGSYGILRSMGVSEDDRHIAVGGIGAVGDGAGFRTNGLMLPLAGFGKKFLSQWGAVTLFDRQTNSARVIPSHLGSILGIECVDVGAGRPPLLAVLGQDRVPSQCGVASPSDQMTWSLRIIRSEDGKQLKRWELPIGKIPPELAAGLSTPGDLQSLVAAVTVNGQVNWYAMGRDAPISIADPYALALDHDSQSGIVTIATSRGLNLHKLSSPQQPRKCDLSEQLTSGDIIFRVKTSHKKGSPHFGAITTRSMSKQSGHQLRLVDIDAARVLSQPVDLGIAQDPVLAVDPTGTFIAATADVGQGVQIFRREDLSSGKTVPTQVLASDFVRVARAAVDDADAKGNRLKLETKTPNGPVQQWELQSGNLKPVNQVPWVVHDSALSFDLKPGQGYQAKGKFDGESLQLPTLSSGLMPLGRMTKLTFLNDRAIAAIAYMQKGGENRPRLELYDGRSGRLLRRLEGHDTAVISIAFSKSTKRLTSVSEDGMVCVWALDDLVDLVDRRGTIVDSRFCYDGSSFLVTAIGSEAEGNNLSSPPSVLQVGDQVLGLMVENDVSSEVNLQTFNSVPRLYRALSFLPVGEQATFRIQRQQRELDVQVPLVQAADERKPLFSMVMTPPQDNRSPAWLAWSPHGPFESSEPSIESRAGWQFNKNGVGGQSQFAPLSEYRDRFFGRGLIDTLLSQGSVPAQWPPRVVPRLYGLVVDSNEKLHLSDGPMLELPHEYLKSFQVEVEGVPSSSVSEVAITFRKQPTFHLSRQHGTQAIWAKSWLPAEPPVKLEPGSRYFVRVSVKSEFFEGGEYTDFWQVTVKSRGLSPALGPVPDQVVKAEPIEKSTDAQLKVNPASQPTDKPQRIETPPLPGIQIVSHRRHNREVTPNQWDGQTSCTLVARVLASAVPADAKFAVEVDGETGIRPIDFAHKEVRGAWFRGVFDLPLGQHLVTLTMKQGDQVMRAPTISILRIDPPEIEVFSFEASENGQGRVKAVVRASQPPRAEDVLVRVANVRFSDLPIRVANLPQPSEENPFQNRYRVELDGIPLKPGRNQLECVVLGRDRASRGPKLAEIIQPPVRLAPRLSVEMMATGAITGTSTLLPYRVESFRDVTMK